MKEEEIAQYRKKAARMKDMLAGFGHFVELGRCQQIVADISGFRNWQTLIAANTQEEPPSGARHVIADNQYFALYLRATAVFLDGQPSQEALRLAGGCLPAHLEWFSGYIWDRLCKHGELFFDALPKCGCPLVVAEMIRTAWIPGNVPAKKLEEIAQFVEQQQELIPIKLVKPE